MGKADADAYAEQLYEQESLSGPYGETLAELLSSLGRYHHERGDFREALELYKRALHVVRVNEGLYSERQLPMVRDLLNLYRESGDLEGLDDRYQYFFRLYGAGHPPYTALRKRASLEYMRWEREAHSLGLDAGKNRRLVDLYLINKQMLESTAEIPELDQEWRQALVLSQMRNLYLLFGLFSTSADSYGVGSFAVTPPSPVEQSEFVQQRLSNIQRTGVAVGRNLLTDLIAQSPQLEPVDRARLHLELGDWYQWNQILKRANEQYAKVETILLQAGESSLLEQWLGAPVELPDNDAFSRPSQNPGDDPAVIATVSFDISGKGNLSHIEVQTEDPEDASVGFRIVRMLKNTHFRPRFVSGQTEAVKHVTRQYQLVE
jgi:tetratricopeptide (TPR) repeat protein